MTETTGSNMENGNGRKRHASLVRISLFVCLALTYQAAGGEVDFEAEYRLDEPWHRKDYPAMRVPESRGVTVDGNLAEWEEAASVWLCPTPSAQAHAGPAFGGPADFSAEVMLMWDDAALYVAVIATDDAAGKAVEDSPASYWKNDSVELLVDFDLRGDAGERTFNDDDFQFVLCPFVSNPETGSPASGHCPQAYQGSTRTAAVRTEDGYRLEAAVPIPAAFRGVMKPGTVLGVNVGVNDMDTSKTWESQIRWYPHGHASSDARARHRVVLVEDPEACTAPEFVRGGITAGTVFDIYRPGEETELFLACGRHVGEASFHVSLLDESGQRRALATVESLRGSRVIRASLREERQEAPEDVVLMAEATVTGEPCFTRRWPVTVAGEIVETILEAGEPMLVAAGPPEVKAWGWYQFPSISRTAWGEIVVSHNLCEDSIRSYGVGKTASYISPDGGVTWIPKEEYKRPPDAKRVPKPDYDLREGGCRFPNGDVIWRRSVAAVPVDQVELPEPATWCPGSYDRTDAPQAMYRLAELPDEWQGFAIWRQSPGKEAVADFARIVDPYDLRAPSLSLFHITVCGEFRMLPDGSVLLGAYPGIYLEDDPERSSGQSIVLWRSTDNGHTWQYWSRILIEPDLRADPFGDMRDAATEPFLEILHDGRLYCVIRTTTGLGVGPLYASASTNMGKTWSTPVVIAPSGVEPQLLKLQNKMLVLSTGRPGVQVRVSPDGLGETWSPPLNIVRPTLLDEGGDTCSYTKLLPTGPDRFMMVYSHFRHVGEDFAERKAILVREICVKQLSRWTGVAPAWRTRFDTPPAIEVRRYYGDAAHTRVDYDIPFVNGKPEGVMKIYFDNGTVAAETPLVRGRTLGTQRLYRRDGSLWKERTWRMGRLDGVSRTYHEAGFVLLEDFYRNWKTCSKEEWVLHENASLFPGREVDATK
ncbi:sugar-binding protein [Verrucomicrobiota bacterium]